MSEDDTLDQHDYLRDKQVSAPATIGEEGQRRFLYPERRSGLRSTQRRIVAVLLIGFYLVAPWVNFRGYPLLRIDVIDQRAYFFGLVLKMNEYVYLFFVLAILALVLFLVTALRGRIWCGYACPQTVFLEWVIRPIEEFLEGPARKRALADKKPLTPQLLLVKIVKQVAFVAVAFLVAHGLLGFFVDPRLIVSWVTSPPGQHFTPFLFVMGVAGLLYFDLSYFREQFCAFLCPYARFQSVMLDAASPSVNYNVGRGEPRGKGKAFGDCIDCGLCVRVCPTGIDIRNGLQLECIQCERCIDACDSVMASLKRPTGLIDIVSIDNLNGRKSKKPWQRGRVLIYSGLIVAVGIFGAIRLQSRPQLALTFTRQPGLAYSNMPDGRLSNVFQVRINNTSGAPTVLALELIEQDAGVELVCPRCGQEIEPHGDDLTPLLVVFPASFAAKTVEIRNRATGAQYSLPIIAKGSR